MGGGGRSVVERRWPVTGGTRKGLSLAAIRPGSGGDRVTRDPVSFTPPFGEVPKTFPAHVPQPRRYTARVATAAVSRVRLMYWVMGPLLAALGPGTKVPGSVHSPASGAANWGCASAGSRLGQPARALTRTSGTTNVASPR